MRLFIKFIITFVYLSGPFCFSVIAQELRDIKPPIDSPVHPAIIISIVLIILLIVGGIIFCIYKIIKALSTNKQRILTSWEKAFQRLELLQKSNLLEEDKFDKYFSELSDVIRRYMEERFQVKAPEMTSEEFFVYVKNAKEIGYEHKQLLKQFLTSCDMIKFAQYTPQSEEGEKIFKAAWNFIQETKLDEN